MDVEAFKAEINAVCSKYGLWLLAPVHTGRISIVTPDYKCVEKDVQFKPSPDRILRDT